MYKKSKLITKIEFGFDDQDNFPVFDVEVETKTKMPNKHIIIDKAKKKTDVSTQLF